MHELPAAPQASPCGQGSHYPPASALTGAIPHKVQVKSSEGHTLQVMYKSSVEEVRAPAAPQSPPPQQREGICTCHIPRQTGKDKWLTGEEVTIPLLGPRSLPSRYYPSPEGAQWVLGSFQEPLTCLWQLWRGQREVGRAGEPPPSQAAQAQALGAEAVAGQFGQCQSPSLERWDQDPQQGWEWGQE